VSFFFIYDDCVPYHSRSHLFCLSNDMVLCMDENAGRNGGKRTSFPGSFPPPEFSSASERERNGNPTDEKSHQNGLFIVPAKSVQSVFDVLC
jgi:hypothetical protein